MNVLVVHRELEEGSISIDEGSVVFRREIGAKEDDDYDAYLFHGSDDSPYKWLELKIIDDEEFKIARKCVIIGQGRGTYHLYEKLKVRMFKRNIGPAEIIRLPWESALRDFKKETNRERFFKLLESNNKEFRVYLFLLQTLDISIRNASQGDVSPVSIWKQIIELPIDFRSTMEMQIQFWVEENKINEKAVKRLDNLTSEILSEDLLDKATKQVDVIKLEANIPKIAKIVRETLEGLSRGLE